jgi:hypothetical protein
VGDALDATVPFRVPRRSVSRQIDPNQDVALVAKTGAAKEQSHLVHKVLNMPSVLEITSKRHRANWREHKGRSVGPFSENSLIF